MALTLDCVQKASFGTSDVWSIGFHYQCLSHTYTVHLLQTNKEGKRDIWGFHGDVHGNGCLLGCRTRSLVENDQRLRNAYCLHHMCEIHLQEGNTWYLRISQRQHRCLCYHSGHSSSRSWYERYLDGRFLGSSTVWFGRYWPTFRGAYCHHHSCGQ